MIVITPVSGGIFASAESGTPSSVPISLTSWLRSNVTTPSPVEIPVAGLVLEHVGELLLRRRVGVDPELLYARRLEQPLDSVGGGLPQCRGDGWRQRLEVVGQPLLEPGRDIHVVVELVDQENRERVLDLRVLDQPGARVLPGLVVEHLPMDPRRQDRAQPDQRGEDDHRPDERATTPAHSPGHPIDVDGSGAGR